ncbi:MAG: BatD family protein [Candidatus Dependentiae bacterium]|nr:BatD family protein [Candidatus Dependentiae bacterium]
MNQWREKMDKIVGKISVVLLSMFVALQLQAGMVLTVADNNGDAVQAIGIGQPFVLQAAIDGGGSVNEWPRIEGLDGAYVRDNGMMRMTINGKTTLKYSYKVRIDTAGTYTIGPASVMQDGSMITSNKVTVRVTDKQTKPDASNTQSNVAFLRLAMSQDRAVVGEKLVCSLRLYYTNEVINISPIEHAPIHGFRFDTNVCQGKGAETIKGIEYNYFELSWDAYPLEPGKKIIPAYAVDFFVQSHKQNPYNAAMALFLGRSQGEHKRIYSNAVSIQIDPLPTTQKTVHAIGAFTHFNATLEPGVAREGEGMVLTLELQGDGSIDKDNALALLQGMPASFKFYDSKNYVVDKKSADDTTKHYFEFIVQGLERGDWQVPAQSFTYFDVKGRSYKTLETLPLSVMILPSVAAKQSVVIPPVTAVDVVEKNDVAVVEDEIKPVYRSMPWVRTKSLAMPWWAFIFFMALPFVFMLVVYFKKSFGLVRFSFYNLTGKKRAFDVARKQIDRALQTRENAQIYHAFIQLFATKYGVDTHQVTQEFMSEKLKSCGIDDTGLEEWHEFFTQLSALVFFAKNYGSKDIASKAYAWLNRLEKAL